MAGGAEALETIADGAAAVGANAAAAWTKAAALGSISAAEDGAGQDDAAREHDKRVAG